MVLLRDLGWLLHLVKVEWLATEYSSPDTKLIMLGDTVPPNVFIDVC